MSRSVHTRRHHSQCLRLHTHRARATGGRRRSGAVSAWTSVRSWLKADTDAPSSLSFREVTVQEAAPCPESSGRFASLGMPSRTGSATSAPPMRLPHSGMARAGATTPVSVPPHQVGTIGFDLAVCLRPCWIPSLRAGCVGLARRARARPGVRRAGGRLATEPGAPERPWVGRSRPGRTHGPARGSSRLLGRDRPYWPR